LNLSHLCQLFDVPVSSYYYQSVHKPNDAAYRDKLTVIHKKTALLSIGKAKAKYSKRVKKAV
jgi:hypothetical protein